MSRIESVALLVLFIFIFLFYLVPHDFVDLWWHLAAGKYIIANGIIKEDVFSHTVAGQEWINHQWLSQVVFYGLFDKFGMISLYILEALSFSLCFFFLYRRTMLFTGRLTSIISVIAAFWLIGSYSMIAESVRPNMFTLLFVSVFVYVLDGFKEDKFDRVWVLLPLLLLWANLHGGAVLGLALIAFYFVDLAISKDSKAKKLAAVALAGILVYNLNPSTYKLMLYPVQYVQNTVHAKFISEWQSPGFHSFGIFEAFLLVSIAAVATNRRPVRIVDLLLLLSFTHLALFAIRNILLYAVVCTPIIVKYLEMAALDFIKVREMDVTKIKTFFIPSFVCSTVFLGAAISFYSYPVDSVLSSDPESGLPRDAVEFIAERNMTGNMFNFYNWGGYIIWRLYPGHRVFVDGRADVYGDFIYDYNSIMGLKPNWSDILDKYDVSFVLIPAELPLGEALNEEEWETVYKDDISVILKRGHSDVK